jgi:cytochrome c peroxidase
MRKGLVIVFLLLTVMASISFTTNDIETEAINLRKLYSRPPAEWPAPFIDAGVNWKELGILPASPLQSQLDSLEHIIELGKILFFDTRLSGSGKIACATCHQPELSWTDGKEKSIGHEGAMNKRNSPSIQNVWFYNKLFWDGRAKDLEDQAFAPINSESEMHHDMRELPLHLKKISGYPVLFDSAFGDPTIDADRIAKALAFFQRTIISRKSRFDDFIGGKKNALTDTELKGLHLFRTKARCMNCHNGPLFSDNQFHNNGFHQNGDPGNDKGRYMVTHNEEDIGKFKTPSLRDVMQTGPWMHTGQMTHILDILFSYNKTSRPIHEPLLQPLFLTSKEISAVVAFLGAISSRPANFTRPVLPR